MTARPWGDHQEHRLTLTRITGCDGAPLYEGGTDQRSFCADGCISFNDSDFHLPVAKLAEFTATLYETAGKPERVILERLDWEDCHQDETAGIRTYLATGNLVGVELGHEDITPDVALHLAARLVSLAAKAKQAAAEPDPAEVGELAALMDAEMERRGAGQSGLYPAVARIALQWMNGRQQRGGERP